MKKKTILIHCMCMTLVSSSSKYKAIRPHSFSNRRTLTHSHRQRREKKYVYTEWNGPVLIALAMVALVSRVSYVRRLLVKVCNGGKLTGLKLTEATEHNRNGKSEDKRTHLLALTSNCSDSACCISYSFHKNNRNNMMTKCENIFYHIKYMNNHDLRKKQTTN